MAWVPIGALAGIPLGVAILPHLDFIESYPVLDSRELLYTGITRGKKLVVLIGQKRALRMALEEAGGMQRWSADSIMANSSGDVI